MDADSSIINLMGNRVLGKLIIIQLIKKSLKFYNTCPITLGLFPKHLV
jgi:hypothetical protein